MNESVCTRKIREVKVGWRWKKKRWENHWGLLKILKYYYMEDMFVDWKMQAVNAYFRLMEKWI